MGKEANSKDTEEKGSLENSPKKVEKQKLEKIIRGRGGGKLSSRSEGGRELKNPRERKKPRNQNGVNTKGKKGGD